MQLSTIKYFYEVSKSTSIRAAAERLHVAASAVSRQIAQLEEELGYPLFERHARGIRLTAAGEIAQEHFREVLLRIEAVQDDLGELKTVRRGRVRIATVEGVVPYLLSNTIADFHRLHPQVTYEVMIDGTAAVVQSIVEGKADLFIAFNVPANAAVRILTQSWQSLYAVVGPSHPLHTAGSISLRDVALLPVAYLTGTHGMRMLLDHAFSRLGVTPRIVMMSNSLEALKSFVHRGMGVTFMPRFAAQREVDEGRLFLLRIEETELVSACLTIGSHVDRPLPRSARELVRHLERLFELLPEQAS